MTKKEIILNSQEMRLVISALKAFEDEIIDGIEKDRKIRNILIHYGNRG